MRGGVVLPSEILRRSDDAGVALRAAPLETLRGSPRNAGTNISSPTEQCFSGLSSLLAAALELDRE